MESEESSALPTSGETEPPREPTPEPEPPKEPTPEPEPPKEPTPEPEAPKEPTPEPEPPKEPTPEPEAPKEPIPEPEPPKEPTPEPEPEPPKEPTPEPEPPKEPAPEPQPPKEPAPESEPSNEPTLETGPEKPDKSEEEQQKTPEIAPAPVVSTAEPEDNEVKEKPKGRTKIRTTSPAEGVDIAMGTEDIEREEPITVGGMFQQTVQRYPDRDGLGYKEGDEWKYIKFPDYYKRCVSAAKSFIKLGLEDFHGVGILGFNSKEWLIANIGAIFAGGLAFGIYATNNPEACQYVAHDCKANILVVENQKQLDKILQVRDQLPHLKAIVQYTGKLSQEYENTYDWEQFMELGKDMDDSVIEEKMAAQKPNQCAVLVYTSGTTGKPKGVMLSHDNVIWVSKVFKLHADGNRDVNHRVVSYLPLSHVAAQIADVYLPITFGSTVFFAQPDALKGSLLKTLNEVKPTLFFGVPRVWEKLAAGVQNAGAQVSGVKKVLGSWAKGRSLRGYQNIQRHASLPWGWTIATKILNKVRTGLGLQNCDIMLTGAAPIHRDTLEYLMSINMPVLELYGMSENSGPHSCNSLNSWRLGSVGKTILGVYTKIDQVDANGEGEICMKGRHVFMGYLNNEEKTKEAIDDDGWLHTGDIGKVDKDGYLFITGRIKELIITSGGENMAPVPVEDRIKEAAPFLSNVVMIGDKRKFISCLVTLKCVMDPDTGEPTDDLDPIALDMITGLGSKCTKVSEVVRHKDKAVFAAIQKALDKCNEKAVSNAQKVQKFTLLEYDFSVPGGELGPTLKLKRHVVNKKYAGQIDAMYDV